MELVFATNNPNKLNELRSKVDNRFRILSLADINCVTEIPETHDTLEDNASEKAFFIHEKFGVNCFADDTGLEISALDGRPGVLSARYAGPDCSPEDNMTKVLSELETATDRSARFRTVISLAMDGGEIQFEGTVDGMILPARQGEEGFGYDPIFQPNGYSLSFAELPMEEKNRISHRGLAVDQLVEYLLQIES